MWVILEVWVILTGADWRSLLPSVSPASLVTPRQLAAQERECLVTMVPVNSDSDTVHIVTVTVVPVDRATVLESPVHGPPTIGDISQLPHGTVICSK